jgi:hypothetical protein
MANESLNDLAKNAENLNSTYDNASTPSSNDTLGDIADNLGWGAAIPSISSITQGGADIGLAGNMGLFANYDSDWAGFRRQRNLGTDGQDKPCNQWICITTADFDYVAYRDDTKLYKNGTLDATSNAGVHGSVGCNAGDLVGVTRPVGQAHGVENDEGFIYLGWAGFAFAHRRDRNSGATLYMVALQGDTDYQIAYTTSDGLVTSLTNGGSGTITNSYTLTNLGSISSTRNYFFYANKPVCVYVRLAASQNVNDSFQLYPMDQDAKYGAFSTGGHMFLTANASQNRSGANVTQQLFNRSSDGTTATERNASSATPSVYIDISPSKTSGSLFAGPVQKLQAGNGCLIAAEQQADSNGSEMTPFVSKKAFGTIGSVVGGASDYVCCIGESAITIYHRAANGTLKATQTMSGSATYSIYFTRFTSSIAGDDIFESNGTQANKFFMYYDSPNDDERVCYMADTLLELSATQIAIAGPFDEPFQACEEGPVATRFNVYVIESFTSGDFLYTDSTCRSELSDGIYYYPTTNQSFSYARYPTGIGDIADC